MGQLILMLGLLLLTQTSTALAEGFDRFEELVHIIKIKSTEKSSEQSLGTGFVVDRNGTIVTNYHVISNVFEKGKTDKKRQIFVKIKAQEYLAEILKIDILNDLALLKVPYLFKEQSHIRQAPLSKGETIFSLGYHDKNFMAINQGTFNDYLAGTDNELMAISCPLNPGMSGGPILDKNFEVVGLNVLKSTKESDGYGINAKRLTAFLGMTKEKNGLSLDEIVNEQMERTYNRLSASIETAEAYRPLNNWSVLSLDDFMECGEFREEHNSDEDQDDANKNKIIVTKKVCHLDPRKVPLSVFGSDMDLVYAIGDIQGGENTRLETYFRYLNNSFKFQGYESVLSGETYRCQRMVVKNGHDLQFKLSICLYKLKSIPTFIKEKKHYRYEVKAVTMRESMDNIVLQAQFSGSKEVAKRFIKKIINGIKLGKNRES